MSSAYRRLEERFRRLFDLQGAAAVLSWDQAVWMPPGGGEARGAQLATLERLQHELLTAPEVESWLEEARSEPLDPWQRANLREMTHRVRRARAVEGRLVEALAQATTRAELVWREARAAADFPRLAPYLAEVVALVREKAEALGEALGLAPYDALLDGYEHGLREEDLERLLVPLGALLPDAVEDALGLKRPVRRPSGPFPAARQRELARALMERLGFDFRHGRLDESAHPFCGGVPTDIRITTRWDEADLTRGLMAVLHETGHALYEAGLPAAWAGQPVGEARGMAVHESQSLLIEMQLCRSAPFLRFLAPRLVEAFGRDPAFAPDNLLALYHRVERGFIRVDADELTYPLHVLLRYRLERQLVLGEIAVADLPALWREGMRELLGVTPPDDRLGVLQDIHWPLGIFGYFPCYTLGALLAAQLFEALGREVTDLEAQVERGEFADLRSWLRERIHGQGCRFLWQELIARATGRPPELAPFLRHLTRRYGVRLSMETAE